MDKENRFKILNEILGYGNSNASIIFIGIEEKEAWSLKNLTKCIPKDSYEASIGKKVKDRLEKIDDRLINEKIEIIRKEFEVDFDQIVNDELKKQKEETKNFVYECEAGDGSATTADIQFKLSKEILILLEKYPKDYNWGNYSKNIFGTKNGNEACLNYFPIARSSEEDYYDEEKYFFGISKRNKFLNEHESKRQKYFLEFFKRIKDRGKENVFIFIMGKNKGKVNSPYVKLKPLIKEIFSIPESDLENSSENPNKFLNSKKIRKNSFIFCYNKKIWFLPSPTRGNIIDDDIKNIIRKIRKINI